VVVVVVVCVCVCVVNVNCKVHGVIRSVFKTVGKACLCTLEANECHGGKTV